MKYMHIKCSKNQSVQIRPPQAFVRVVLLTGEILPLRPGKLKHFRIYFQKLICSITQNSRFERRGNKIPRELLLSRSKHAGKNNSSKQCRSLTRPKYSFILSIDISLLYSNVSCYHFDTRRYFFRENTY